MSRKQIFFFADADDLKPVVKEFEANNSVTYAQTGLQDDKNPVTHESLLALPDLGSVSHGDWNHTKSFLVMQKGDTVKVREVPQRAGGTKYAIDQMLNANSIVFKPSGIFKDQILVAGSAGTVSQDAFSVKSFTAISKLIKKSFKKIGTFYVGPNAKQKLSAGWRLVTLDKSPKEYDLKEE
jgi:hypothetical protein